MCDKDKNHRRAHIQTPRGSEAAHTLQDPAGPLPHLPLVARPPAPPLTLAPPPAALLLSRLLALRPRCFPLLTALALTQVDKLGDILACLELLVQPGRRLARLRHRLPAARSLAPPPACLPSPPACLPSWHA